MKIYIYAIAKNEEKFVDRFMESVKDADKVIVCDTGSTDKTIPLLEKRGAEVHKIQVSPFRFDLARNMALLHCEEADVVIALDLDEIMTEGWREKIEKNWKAGETNLLKYRMTYSWRDKEQTIPSLTIWGLKVHCPKTWIWVDPVNENLALREGCKQNVVIVNEHLMVHHPEEKEERGGRIKMMKEWVEREPKNARALYCYGSELSYLKKWKESIDILKRYLSNSVAYAENERGRRASTCRLIAKGLNETKGDINEIMIWLLRGVGENPTQREPWIWLAQGWLLAGDLDFAEVAVNRGLAITNQEESLTQEHGCWSEQVDDLLKTIKKAKYGK